MVFLHGLAAGSGLIIAIGAQNAFVLNNALRRNYIFTIVLICSLCDAVLISAGISGVGAVIAQHPIFAQMALWGGVVFLCYYGLCSFASMVRGSEGLNSTWSADTSYSGIILATLGVTLLNPHVYLDTMLLIGSIGSQFSGQERICFAAGAITASILWFSTLGFGGRELAPFFKTPGSWRILDGMVGVMMFSVAVALLTK